MELLEIEKELAGPRREEALRRYDAKLVAIERRVGEMLKSGVAPDEYERCNMLVEAVVVARKLLRLQVKDAERIS